TSSVPEKSPPKLPSSPGRTSVKGSGQGIFFENYPRFRLFLRQEQFSFFHEVDIELMDAKERWASYMPLDDALKLDDVRSIIMQYQSGMAAPF
ncbi:MAG: hypothetical protein WAU34_13715, partial [Desulfobacterales bacterium]